MRRFDDLNEQELLALAISNEEEDGRIYTDFVEHVRQHYPENTAVSDDLAAEEDGHRRALLNLYVGRFGRHLPYVTRREVRGAPAPQSQRSVIRRGVDAVRAAATRMEAAARSTDAATRKRTSRRQRSSCWPS